MDKLQFCCFSALAFTFQEKQQNHLGEMLSAFTDTGHLVNTAMFKKKQASAHFVLWMF